MQSARLGIRSCGFAVVLHDIANRHLIFTADIGIIEILQDKRIGDKRMKPERKINQEYLTGERPLFGESQLQINNTIFAEGESPLKECHHIEMENSMFQWKYPLWYSSDIEVKDSTWAEMARAGVWYTNNIHIENALIEAPKNFRRCNELKLDNVFLPNAAETLWHCSNVTLNQVRAKGDYFAMNCTDMQINDFELAGNY